MTQALQTEPRLSAPDDFYEALVAMHRDLDEDTSRVVNAKLILLLANHIGDEQVLREAMCLARNGASPGAGSGPHARDL